MKTHLPDPKFSDAILCGNEGGSAILSTHDLCANCLRKMLALLKPAKATPAVQTMTCGDCGGTGHDHGADVPCADEPETSDAPASPCDEDCGQCDGSGEVSVLVD